MANLSGNLSIVLATLAGERSTTLSRRGLELVGTYSGLAWILMGRWLVEIVSECPLSTGGRTFDKLDIHEIPHYWLEMIAVSV